MATKKPSLTKQIGEVLGTEDKREQLDRIQRAVDRAQSPAVAITVLYFDGTIELSVAGTANITGDQMKMVLSQAQDRITEAQVKASIEAREKEEPRGPQTGDTMANGDMTP